MSESMPKPAYATRATLAALLDCSESTIDEWVRRGIIPRPIKLPTGGVRFRWEDVDLALRNLNANASAGETADPYIQGAINATQAPPRKGNGDASQGRA
jgi:predicted DNA-binding transcriptional regulator AlpA